MTSVGNPKIPRVSKACEQWCSEHGLKNKTLTKAYRKKFANKVMIHSIKSQEYPSALTRFIKTVRKDGIDESKIFMDIKKKNPTPPPTTTTTTMKSPTQDTDLMSVGPSKKVTVREDYSSSSDDSDDESDDLVNYNRIPATQHVSSDDDDEEKELQLPMSKKPKIQAGTQREDSDESEDELLNEVKPKSKKRIVLGTPTQKEEEYQHVVDIHFSDEEVSHKKTTPPKQPAEEQNVSPEGKKFLPPYKITTQQPLPEFGEASSSDLAHLHDFMMTDYQVSDEVSFDKLYAEQKTDTAKIDLIDRFWDSKNREKYTAMHERIQNTMNTFMSEYSIFMKRLETEREVLMKKKESKTKEELELQAQIQQLQERLRKLTEE